MDQKREREEEQSSERHGGTVKARGSARKNEKDHGNRFNRLQSPFLTTRITTFHEPRKWHCTSLVIRFGDLLRPP